MTLAYQKSRAAEIGHHSSPRAMQYTRTVPSPQRELFERFCNLLRANSFCAPSTSSSKGYLAVLEGPCLSRPWRCGGAWKISALCPSASGQPPDRATLRCEFSVGTRFRSHWSIAERRHNPRCQSSNSSTAGNAARECSCPGDTGRCRSHERLGRGGAAEPEIFPKAFAEVQSHDVQAYSADARRLKCQLGRDDEASWQRTSFQCCKFSSICFW